VAQIIKNNFWTWHKLHIPFFVLLGIFWNKLHTSFYSNTRLISSNRGYCCCDDDDNDDDDGGGGGGGSKTHTLFNPTKYFITCPLSIYICDDTSTNMRLLFDFSFSPYFLQNITIVKNTLHYNLINTLS